MTWKKWRLSICSEMMYCTQEQRIGHPFRSIILRTIGHLLEMQNMIAEIKNLLDGHLSQRNEDFYSSPCVRDCLQQLYSYNPKMETAEVSYGDERLNKPWCILLRNKGRQTGVTLRKCWSRKLQGPSLHWSNNWAGRNCLKQGFGQSRI